MEHFFPRIQVKTKKQKQKKVFTRNGTLFSPNSGEDQKKGLYQKWNAFFPNWNGDLRSGAKKSQIIGGM